jgi:hypothetical protein
MASKIKIIKVCVGSHPDKIMVYVGEKDKSTIQAIYWDVSLDREIIMFDVSLNSQLFWNSKGEPLIAEPDHIILMEEKIRIKQFRSLNPRQY